MTSRDEQVLLLLADGSTYQEIAAELGLAAYSVKERVARLRLMFDARTTPHLVAKAYHEGVLVAP